MAYIGNQTTSTSFTVDTFSGTGSQTVFTGLTFAPAATASIAVFVAGVYQAPTSYSLSGTTLTFSSAPAAGTSNIRVLHLGTGATAGIPSDGSVTTDKIADSAITTAKIAAGAVVTSDIADANVTDAKIVSVANTKITGLVTSAQIASVANTQITGVITATQLANTAVTAGTYGGSDNVSRITVDAQGRVTSASNVAISIPTTSYATNSNNSIFVANTTVTGNVTISSNTGALSIGPLILNSGRTITVSSNARHVIL